MHEFEWNVKQITGWIFDILIYWAISYKNSWSSPLDFILPVLHHICHQFTPCSFHSYEPASQERLVVVRAGENYLQADIETVGRGLSLSVDRNNLWDALTCPRTWRLFFLGCKDISSQQMAGGRWAFAQQQGRDPSGELKRRSSMASNHPAAASGSSAFHFCTSWNLPRKRHGHCRQQGQTSALIKYTNALQLPKILFN